MVKIKDLKKEKIGEILFIICLITIIGVSLMLFRFGCKLFGGDAVILFIAGIMFWMSITIFIEKIMDKNRLNKKEED